jgi:hypothetical protein
MSHAEEQRRKGEKLGRNIPACVYVSRKEAKAQRRNGFSFSSQPEAYQDSISMSHAKAQRRKGGGLTQRRNGGGLSLSWCVRDHSMEPTSISQRIPQRIPQRITHCVPQRDGMFRGPLFELWV